MAPRPSSIACSMVLEYVVDDEARVGVDLRVHRGPHELEGKGQSLRLVKMLPANVKDKGSAAGMLFNFVEWPVAPILFPDDEVKSTFSTRKKHLFA